MPVIIPCVLYIGKRKWNKSTAFKSLFKDSKLYEEILPNFKYILIDVNDYDDETLLNLTGIMGNVLYIEKGKEFNEIKIRLVNLLERIQNMNFEEQKSFAEWVAHLIAKDKNDIELIKTNIIDKEEKSMLGEFIEQLTQEWIDEGVVKGREEGIKKGIEMGREEGMIAGREEGMIVGRINTLKKLLQNKLGKIPDIVIQKIDSMTKEEIDLLEQKIFSIKSWKEI